MPLSIATSKGVPIPLFISFSLSISLLFIHLSYPTVLERERGREHDPESWRPGLLPGLAQGDAV